MLRKLSIGLAALVASVQALDLKVSPSGGNKTDLLHYGLMFEVNDCFS